MYNSAKYKQAFFSRFQQKVICITLFTLLILQAQIYAQKIVTYAIPEGIAANNDFSVKVRQAGNKWKEINVYEVLVDGHKVQKSSMANFDFEGEVQIAVISNNATIKTARIRPLSYSVPFQLKGDTILFSMKEPKDISVEINGDIFHNLQLFTNKIEKNRPIKGDKNLIYLEPGIHTFESLTLKSGQSLYLAGGAILKGKVVCDSVSNVRVFGRGIIYKGYRGVEITNSNNVSVEDIIFINPTHYTIFGGQSDNLKIHHIRSFSAKGWSDGIDLMSCKDVLIEDVFMRNSDDCIALYGHRWDYYGDCRNIKVQNSTLWADVAHPIMIGTHGNPEPGKSETIENLVFNNIDILNHDEPQIDYQGCMAINVSDENLAKNIYFENIRIEDFEQGQLINLRVTYNKKYALAPGRGIENVYFKNVTYTGKNANISIIEGYSGDRNISNIVFENLIINNIDIAKINKGYKKHSDFARFYEGLFTDKITYLSTNENSQK